jgi:hypothetical protein
MLTLSPLSFNRIRDSYFEAGSLLIIQFRSKRSSKLATALISINSLHFWTVRPWLDAEYGLKFGTGGSWITNNFTRGSLPIVNEHPGL